MHYYLNRYTIKNKTVLNWHDIVDMYCFVALSNILILSDLSIKSIS